MIHIPFGTVLFLRSDVPHAGCYGSAGNLRLHCSFQCADNIGEDLELFYLDKFCQEESKLGDQKQYIYTKCNIEYDDPTPIPIVDNRANVFWQQEYYMSQWKVCTDWRTIDGAEKMIAPIPLKPSKAPASKEINSEKVIEVPSQASSSHHVYLSNDSDEDVYDLDEELVSYGPTNKPRKGNKKTKKRKKTLKL